MIDEYVDDGFSAKDLKRPQVKRLLLDINRDRINTVLFTEISRLSRSVSDWIDLRQFFVDKEAAFIATRQAFDTTNAMGRAMLNFAIEFSQLEREMTAERVRASYHARAGRGLFTGGPIPYGLDKGEKNGHLVINAAKQVVAGEIIDILLNKAGCATRAVEIINERSYRRDKGVAWDEKALCRWVRHYAVVGKVEINAANKTKDQERLPEAERYKVVDAVWEPLVPEDRWLRANELLDQNHQRLKVAQWKYNDFILTGILRCPEGKGLVGSSGTGRSGKKYANYKHSPRVDCGCHVKTVSAPKVESAVIGELKKLVRSPEVVDQLVKHANDSFNAQRPDFRETLSATRRRLAGVTTKLEKITDQVLECDEPRQREIWIEKMHRAQDERKGIEREIEEADQRARDSSASKLDGRQIREALDALDRDFARQPPAAKRSYLGNIVSDVIVDKDEIRINVVNPGFAIGWDSGLPVNLATQRFAHRDGWLPGTGSRLASSTTPLGRTRHS